MAPRRMVGAFWQRQPEEIPKLASLRRAPLPLLSTKLSSTAFLYASYPSGRLRSSISQNIQELWKLSRTNLFSHFASSILGGYIRSSSRIGFALLPPSPQTPALPPLRLRPPRHPHSLPRMWVQSS